jgi:hypothetical protein
VRGDSGPELDRPVGFRYRRKAGVGASFSGSGRFSSVNCGLIDRIERVKKSSGWALSGVG